MKPIMILLDFIFIGIYVGVMFGLYHLGRFPRSISVLDFFLLALAAARVADVISTDQIMQWLREPFVEMAKEEVAGREVEVRTGRGHGVRRVCGDLLTCPWCVAVWVAAGLTYLYFFIPRLIWVFILLMAIAEVGSILQTISTILVRIEKYLKGLGVPEEGL